MYNDDNTVVYLSYPADLGPPPRWMDNLLGIDKKDPNSSFRFYLSGGLIHPTLLPVLTSRGDNNKSAQLLAMKLAQGYTTRLVDSVLSRDIDKIALLASENPFSTEYRLLQDLWVLSRSDIFVVDCDSLGRARCGMESVYAHNCVRTLGVSDSSSFDPWYQYHLDSMVTSPRAFDAINRIRLASSSATSISD